MSLEPSSIPLPFAASVLRQDTLLHPVQAITPYTLSGVCLPLTLVKVPPTLNSSADMRSQQHGGTVAEVHRHLLPGLPNNSVQIDSRVAIPLLQYECGNTQKNWSPKNPILFFTNGRPGVKLSVALSGDFRGIDGRDDFPLGEDGCVITIRIHVGS